MVGSRFSVSRALTASVLLLSVGGVALPKGDHISKHTLAKKVKHSKPWLKEIGDIDGNGAVDYIALTPTENETAGAVRIYMMKDKESHFFSRLITNHKWGFNMPLKTGDTFGTSVAKIGDVNGDGVQDIAVGAPGDNSDGRHSGAVYILMLKKDGAVLKTVKLSASSDSNLRKQHKNKEGFGTTLTSLQDINGDKIKELSVGSTDGSKTLVLLNKKGDAISSMKFAKNVEPKHLQPRFMTNTRVRALSSEEMTDSEDEAAEKKMLTRLSVKALTPAPAAGVGCFFNATACACREFASASTCLDTVATENGQTVCLDRPCHPSYKCDCTGTDLCKREETTESNYQPVPGTPSDKGLAFCEIRPSTMMRTILVPGASVPTSSSLSGHGSGVWTSKKCSCSLKTSFTNTSTKCLDLKRKNGSQDICTVRDCKKSGDMVCDIDGKSTCTLASSTKEVYVNNGSNGITNEAKCSQVKVTTDIAKCVENCPN